jgi:hypothetical protein
MTADEARRWLILSSLIITGIQAVFLLVAPVIGVPIDFPKNLGLLQIVTPVFVGYLGSAAHFIFMSPPPVVPVKSQFLGLLVRGPLIIYAAVVAAAFGAFTYSNRPGAAIGQGMSVDSLGTSLTIALSLLAASTGVIITYLFAVNERASAAPPQTDMAASVVRHPPARTVDDPPGQL